MIHVISVIIGVYPHKYIGHEDNVQTGDVVWVRYMLFDSICVITSYYCKVVVGLRTQFCTKYRCPLNTAKSGELSFVTNFMVDPTGR